MVQKSPSRGRPRSFEPERVLADARATFWKHGFAGTSMDQLVAATGLHKPSLYGAFGDKRQLYVRTLLDYLAQIGAEMEAALDRPRLLDSLEALSQRALHMFTCNACGGCFMMSTAVPVAAEDPEIGGIVRDAMAWLDRAVVRRFRRAVEEKEIAPGVDVEALAMVVVAHHYDLGARVRAGFPPETLEAMSRRITAFVAASSGLEAGPGDA